MQAADDAGQQVENVQKEEGPANPAEVDWVTLNKQFKRKAGLWGASDPAPRLTLLAMSITAMEQVMHPFLAMSGDEWEGKQRQLAMAGAWSPEPILARSTRSYKFDYQVTGSRI